MKNRSKSPAKSATPEASSPAVRKRMLATRQRDTPAETELRQALYALGLRYRVDVSVGGLRSRADVAFLGARVAVFVDGCFWHGCPVHATWPKTNDVWWRQKIEGNRLRDQANTEKLREAGWQVFRFWAHEDMHAAAEAVFNAVRNAGSGSKQ